MTKDKIYNEDTTKNDSIYVESQCTIISNTSNLEILQGDDNKIIHNNDENIPANNTINEKKNTNTLILDISEFENNFNVTNLSNDGKFEDTTNNSINNEKDYISKTYTNHSSTLNEQLTNLQINCDDSNTSFNIDTNNDTNNIDTNDSVYLSNIYNLISSLNKKMETLQTKNVIHESFMYHYKNIYKYIMLNKTAEAKEYMKAICQEDFNNENKYEKINKLKDLINIIIKQIENMKEMVKVLRNKENKSDFYKKEVNSFFNKLQRIINKSQIVENKKNTDFTVDDRNKLHNDFVNDSLESVTSGSEIKLFNLQCNKKNKYNAVLKQVKMIVEQKENSTIDLKEENIKLQENLNIVQKTNVKLKKDCAVLANELNIQKESNKKRQSVIEKQKKIINMLQTKFEKEDNHCTIKVIEKNRRFEV